jgi:hypothetical protein
VVRRLAREENLMVSWRLSNIVVKRERRKNRCALNVRWAGQVGHAMHDQEAAAIFDIVAFIAQAL